METRAPTTGRLAVIVVFSVSCLLLLVYLWTAFGGPVPLKARSYEVRVAVPDAGALGIEADVRTSGVPIGRVVDKRLDRASGRTLVTLSIKPQFAPIPADTRVILRQKTLLGETYVELSGGDPDRAPLPDRGRLPDASVDHAVQLDEILGTLDAPTRRAFQVWQQQLGRAVAHRGADLNATLATLPEFTGDATDVLATLDAQQDAVHRLVRDTGRVFAAIGGHRARLQQLVRSADGVFGAAASRQRRLAETIELLPPFMRELRTTLQHVDGLAVDADPVVRRLTVASPRLDPALRDFARMAPSLRAVVDRLDPLTRAARTGLPALRRTVDGIRPLFGALVPFLSEVNPILQWLEYNQRLTIGVFNAPVGLAYTVPPDGKGVVGHVLRSLSPAGLESIGLWPQRLPTDRGNTYRSPVDHLGRTYADRMIQPSFDCRNTGRGEFTTQKHDTNDDPSCWTLGFPGWLSQHGVLPHIERADYTHR